MFKPDSDLARYLFEAASLGPEAFHVVSFRGEEEISQPFRFELDLISNDPYLDFSQIINNAATFYMRRGEDKLPLAGIVIDFEQAGRDQNYDYTQYRAVLVPRLWRLTLNYRSRIFQHKSVPDIVKLVLQENGLTDFEINATASYETREYTVQYQETDLNFISRLLEFEGFSYFFKHETNKDTLVITDSQDDFAPIAGKTEIPYQYRTVDSRKADSEAIVEVVARERLVSGTFVLNDYNYRTPNTDLRVESKLNGDMPGMTYLYGQHYKDKSSGERIVRVRNEQVESTRRVITGGGGSAGLRTGHRFTLADHYRSDLNEEYLLTRVEHRGVQHHITDAIFGDDNPFEGEPPYRNAFVCIPATTTYRPPLVTPKPRIHGIMTGTVIGDSDYASLDDVGRYHANMHFDLDKEGSRPVRQMQQYTGIGEAGIHRPPHAGTEMVWSAIDGDPDRPYAIGSGPNPNTPAPVDAENNSQHIFRTTSDNLYLVEDRSGKERITLHTPRHETILSLGHTHEFGNEGATLTTDEKVLVRGSKGIVMQAAADGFFLTGWPDVGSAKIGENLQLAIPVATALVASISGKFIDAPPPISKVVEFAMKMQDLWGKANTAAKGAKGILGDNSYTKFMDQFGTPGMFFTCMGGIDFVNPDAFNITTGGGFSLLTPQEAKITAANDIGLYTGSNIGMYARHGYIQMVADTKDIYAKAVDANIVHRAKKGIVNSAGGPIYLKAGDAVDDLKRKTFGSIGKDILGKFKKKETKEDTEYVLPPTDQDKRIQLNAEDGIYIHAQKQDVIIQSDQKSVAIAGEKVALGGEKGVEIYDDTKQIELKCGQSRILLKHNGDITIEGMNITIKATKDVKINGMNITSAATMKNLTKGTMVNSEASGINTVKGSLVKIN